MRLNGEAVTKLFNGKTCSKLHYRLVIKLGPSLGCAPVPEPYTYMTLFSNIFFFEIDLLMQAKFYVELLSGREQNYTNTSMNLS